MYHTILATTDVENSQTHEASLNLINATKLLMLTTMLILFCHLSNAGSVDVAKRIRGAILISFWDLFSNTSLDFYCVILPLVERDEKYYLFGHFSPVIGNIIESFLM